LAVVMEHPYHPPSRRQGILRSHSRIILMSRLCPTKDCQGRPRARAHHRGPGKTPLTAGLTLQNRVFEATIFPQMLAISTFLFLAKQWCTQDSGVTHTNRCKKMLVSGCAGEHERMQRAGGGRTQEDTSIQQTKEKRGWVGGCELGGWGRSVRPSAPPPSPITPAPRFRTSPVGLRGTAPTWTKGWTMAAPGTQ
jgi:hypothetical protein